MTDNVVNLADFRKPFVPSTEPHHVFKEVLDDSTQHAFNEMRLWRLRALKEHAQLQVLAEEFEPSTTCPLDHPALKPMLDLRYKNKTIRDLFFPPPKELAGYISNDIYTKFGIGVRYTDAGQVMRVYVNLGNTLFTKVRAAYEKAGLDFVTSMASAAVALKFQDQPPEGQRFNYDAKAVFEFPRDAADDE